MLSLNAKYTICNLLLTTFFGLSGIMAGAQDKDNFLALTANNINFNLNTPGSLENQQVVPNAITLTVSSKQYSYSISARVSSFSASTSTPIAVSNLGLKLRSKSSTTAYADYNIKFLSDTDQMIAYDSKSNKDDFYYYDLILNPIGYDKIPGTYSFTIMFTLTQP
jgi:hypothetical protein